MEKTLREVYGARGAIQALLNMNVFDAAMSFRIGAIGGAMRPHIDGVEKQRKALIDKYGKLDDKNEMRVPPNTEEFNQFLAEWESLMDTKVEVVVTPVRIPGDVKGILPAIFMDLEGLVTLKT